jgi:putative oxidoreductase
MKTNAAWRFWNALTARLDGANETIPPLILRLIMGWEFWESGLEKFNGHNWFADIQARFPFPFDVIAPGISWSIATSFELGGAVLLWIGLGTRLAAFVLLFLTFVATAAVHWPTMWMMWSDLAKGYAITDMGHGNFKLPLLFAVMLLPLIFGGGGRLSLDHGLSRLMGLEKFAPAHGLATAAIGAAVFAIPFLMLIPVLGFALLVAAIVLALLARRRGTAGAMTPSIPSVR